MTLYSIYQIAANNNIEIIDMELKSSKAKIVKCYDKTCIAINKRQINDATEEKQVLMACLGHYFSNSLYSLTDDEKFIANCNSKAKKWVCDELNV